MLLVKQWHSNDTNSRRKPNLFPDAPNVYCIMEQTLPWTRLPRYSSIRFAINRYNKLTVGKSTLLNALFSTQFATMSGTRQQTTKGIWMVASESMLVMDVEGTDGRERGQDQDFERKSALFSLSVASVLLINMWVSLYLR